MMKLKPKNWKIFQHYNRRSPPWVKLHRSFLDDFDFQRLPLASKALAPMLWLLASESDDGEIDASLEYLCFRLRWSESDIKDGLKPLIDNGFFIPASETLAECLRDATPETETEVETEVETEKEANASSPNAGKKPASEAGPPAHEIPLTGGKSHHVTETDIERYQGLFPSIDVEQSVRAMLAWLDSNPDRRSGSVRGAKTRMTSWLARDQDRASRGPPRLNGNKPLIADDHRSKTYTGTPDDDLPANLR